MKHFRVCLLLMISFLLTNLVLSKIAISAEQVNRQSNDKNTKDKLELETLRIQGNKELPNGLYIVPWRDIKKRKGMKSTQRLVLHSLYGDLFEPFNPNDFIDDTNSTAIK